MNLQREIYVNFIIYNCVKLASGKFCIYDTMNLNSHECSFKNECESNKEILNFMIFRFPYIFKGNGFVKYLCHMIKKEAFTSIHPSLNVIKFQSLKL